MSKILSDEELKYLKPALCNKEEEEDEETDESMDEFFTDFLNSSSRSILDKVFVFLLAFKIFFNIADLTFSCITIYAVFVNDESLEKWTSYGGIVIIVLVVLESVTSKMMSLCLEASLMQQLHYMKMISIELGKWPQEIDFENSCTLEVGRCYCQCYDIKHCSYYCSKPIIWCKHSTQDALENFKSERKRVPLNGKSLAYSLTRLPKLYNIVEEDRTFSCCPEGCAACSRAFKSLLECALGCMGVIRGVGKIFPEIVRILFQLSDNIVLNFEHILKLTDVQHKILFSVLFVMSVTVTLIILGNTLFGEICRYRTCVTFEVAERLQRECNRLQAMESKILSSSDERISKETKEAVENRELRMCVYLLHQSEKDKKSQECCRKTNCDHESEKGDFN